MACRPGEAIAAGAADEETLQRVLAAARATDEGCAVPPELLLRLAKVAGDTMGGTEMTTHSASRRNDAGAR